MSAYYNEIDPYAAQWLRNLIDAGHIAPGYVDERSIEDVKPTELMGYTQCHFFAGIGVWSLALRNAGWPDSRPVWTGSCPCQPFSAAGKSAGFDDERHLWPAWHWLIQQCKPGDIFGEQVASKAAEPWLDLVQIDLEALGYAFGAVAFPSAGVGAPHIRDRTYWVGDAKREGLEGHTWDGSAEGRQGQSGPVAEAGLSGGMGNASSESSERNARGISGKEAQSSSEGYSDGRYGHRHSDASEVGRMADTRLPQRESQQDERPTRLLGTPVQQKEPRHLPGDMVSAPCSASEGGPTNGFWRDPDWLFCRDGKWRPVEPGTFPLVDGAPSRVGRLRAYGNAINAKAAEEFIRSAM